MVRDDARLCHRTRSNFPAEFSLWYSGDTKQNCFMSLSQRIVIKVGSNVLIKHGQIDRAFYDALFREINSLKQERWQPILVLSGAIASGEAQAQLRTKQAAAAYGQLVVINSVQEVARQFNVPLGLLLLSREDIANRQRYEALRETLSDLANNSIIPIINENDATAQTGQTDFRDNDHLAAIVAMIVEAERLVLMTDVDGVYEDFSEASQSGRVLPIIKTST